MDGVGDLSGEEVWGKRRGEGAGLGEGQERKVVERGEAFGSRFHSLVCSVLGRKGEVCCTALQAGFLYKV